MSTQSNVDTDNLTERQKKYKAFIDRCVAEKKPIVFDEFIHSHSNFILTNMANIMCSIAAIGSRN